MQDFLEQSSRTSSSSSTESAKRSHIPDKGASDKNLQRRKIVHSSANVLPAISPLRRDAKEVDTIRTNQRQTEFPFQDGLGSVNHDHFGRPPYPRQQSVGYQHSGANASAVYFPTPSPSIPQLQNALSVPSLPVPLWRNRTLGLGYDLSAYEQQIFAAEQMRGEYRQQQRREQYDPTFARAPGSHGLGSNWPTASSGRTAGLNASHPQIATQISMESYAHKDPQLQATTEQAQRQSTNNRMPPNRESHYPAYRNAYQQEERHKQLIALMGATPSQDESPFFAAMAGLNEQPHNNTQTYFPMEDPFPFQKNAAQQAQVASSSFNIQPVAASPRFESSSRQYASMRAPSAQQQNEQAVALQFRLGDCDSYGYPSWQQEFFARTDRGATSAYPDGNRSTAAPVSTQQRTRYQDGNNNSEERSSFVMIMALPSDASQLTVYQLLLRQSLEYFSATQHDVEARVRGRKQKIRFGQIGIRCRYCAHLRVPHRGKGAVYYPKTMINVYQAAQNISGAHLSAADYNCPFVPRAIIEELEVQKPRRDASKAGRAYWIATCKDMGVVERDGALWLSGTPPTTSPVKED